MRNISQEAAAQLRATRFNTVRKGADLDQVQQVLDGAATTIERLGQELNQAALLVAASEAGNAARILTMAEKVAAESEQAARDEAARIIAEGEGRADDIVAAAEQRSAEIVAAGQETADGIVADARSQAAEIIAGAERDAATTREWANQDAAAIRAAAAQDEAAAHARRDASNAEADRLDGIATTTHALLEEQRWALKNMAAAAKALSAQLDQLSDLATATAEANADAEAGDSVS